MANATSDILTRCSDRSLSSLAQGLIGSEVLKIAGEVRAYASSGRSVANLTVGDFAPTEFRIPRALEAQIVANLAAGQTNYPPSDGTLELRRAVLAFFQESFGLEYPLESTLIAGGSRPIIFAAYAAVVDRGDAVIYPTPSWNNNHYTYLSGGRPIELKVGAETNFMPTAAMIRPHVREAALLAVCTPLNPTGTVMNRGEVEAIATLAVEENERRATTGQRPLFILWDQVYWMLTFGENRHWTPPQVVPEAAAYTIFVDGISKALAATGLRVGWTVAPPAVTARMRDIIGHVGAWSPKAEQLAVATFLGQKDEIASYHETMIRELRLRLDTLYDGLMEMRREGLPVNAIAPQGAIYLSAQFNLIDRFGTNEAIRRFLLEQAGFAVVPFQAFGTKEEDGWFRLSAGAVSVRDCEEGLVRVRAAIAGLA
ncbi:MAG: aminotransferase class I/II-fold pyridoxal phosphate-dependent enzyme [Acidobacteria bacterium]|nr:aminotransferase class I/II-fold pyridoxal phosphate-dependent enzyme [Acidobacteriota bacterium]MBV9474534.1 aminotransferase class I/II-fold pyridoxal phosphate-dependent enzyme [Acidobacteriota bacterium]